MDSSDLSSEKSTPARNAGSKTSSKSNSAVRNSRTANRSRTKVPNKIGKNAEMVKGAKKSAKKPKAGSKSNARGYKADSAADDAEYHYGSDFFDEEDEVKPESQHSDESDVPIDDVSDEEEILLDDVSDVGSSFVEAFSRSPTPMPVWLQDRIDLPTLDLPPSSDDLLIGKENVLRALSVYELMMRFRRAFRLSPFRIEDFCAALAAEEQSNLVSEVHIQLLKAIMRNCDAQQIMFGPPDLRDVINVNFYFLDAMTWPAVLKAFFESQEKFALELKIVTEKNYPYCNVGDRLTVIETLVEELMESEAVREIINTADGKVEHEDHCRACHALGELLCCDTCTAVYHEECLVPPLKEEPTQGWQCPVCAAENVLGVSDCLKPEERYAVRHQSLGFDRHGRKYWFICRRLVIEHETETWYYSTEAQFDELLALLDPDDYEDKLCERVIAEQDVVRQHMQLTMELTEMHRVHGKPLYLTTEIEEAKKRMEDRKYAAEAAAKQKAEEEAAVLAEQLEAEQVEAARQLEGLSTVARNESVEESDKKSDDLVAKLLETSRSGGMTTRMRSGVIQPVKYALLDDAKKPAPAQRVDHSRPKVVGPYKLGMEGNHKHYRNHYAENPLALSKAQHHDEKERRQQLARKFALSQSADFEWTGVVNGTEAMSVLTLRNTVEKLLGSMDMPFLHVNWPKVLPVWSKNLRDASLADEFRVLLTILAQVIKPPVYMSLWNDGSGHTRLHVSTGVERDQLKKREKKEQKEKEALEEKCKTMGTFVKYTLGLKHQVARQKGEDYRVHGEGGWCWVSKTRAKRTADSTKMGLRAGPVKCLVRSPAGFECLSMKEMQRRAQGPSNIPLGSVPDDVMDELGDIFSPEDDDEQKMDTSEPTTDAGKTSHPGDKIMDMLAKPDEEELTSVDMSTALSFIPAEGVVGDPALAKRRALYPKLGAPGLLDNLLASRLAQMAADGQTVRRFVIRRNPVQEEPVEPFKEEVFPEFEVHSHRVKAVIDEYKEKARNAQDSVPLLGSFFNEILALGKSTYIWSGSKIPCYSMSCPSRTVKSPTKDAEPTMKCYSPMCRLKTEGQLLLADLKHVLMKMKAHKEFSKRERERIEREKVEKRKKLLDADPGPGDVVLYKCADKVNLRPECLVAGFLAGNELARKHAKGAQKTLIPLTSRFRTKHGESSCLIPPAYEARRCARRKGRWNFSGYLYNAKPLPHYFWPYPCPRPSFKTTWLWRTSKMTSIHDAAMQMRLLWASLRWDAIHMKPPPESKLSQPQLLADNSEVRRTDVLEKRQAGEFLEKTQFKVRRIIIPADVTKATVRDVHNPARFGLRARRSQLVETHTQEPTTAEDWIPEEQLELWELKQYHEKADKAMAMAKVKEKEKAARDETIAATMARLTKEKEHAASRQQAAETASKAREEQKKVKVVVQGQQMTEINPAAWVASGAKVNAEVTPEPQAATSEPQLTAPSVVTLVNADGSVRGPEQLTAMMEDSLRRQRENNKKRLSTKEGPGTSAIMEMRKRELGATAASLFGVQQQQQQQPKAETVSLRGLIDSGKFQLTRGPDGKLYGQITGSGQSTMQVAGALGGVLPPGKIIEVGGRRLIIAGKGGSAPAPIPRIVLPHGTNIPAGAQIQIPTSILNAVRQAQAQQQAQIQVQAQQQPQEMFVEQPQPEQPQPEPQNQHPEPEQPEQQQIQLTTSGPLPKEQRLILTQTPDGKMNVTGLLPGQQIVRTHDGMFHLVCSNAGTALPAEQELQQVESEDQLQLQQPEHFDGQQMMQEAHVVGSQAEEPSFGMAMTQEQQPNGPDELHMAQEHLVPGDEHQLMLPQQDQQGLQVSQMTDDHAMMPPSAMPGSVATAEISQQEEFLPLQQQQIQQALALQQRQDALILQQQHQEALVLQQQQQQHEEQLQAELHRLHMEQQQQQQQQLHDPQYHPELVAQQQMQAQLVEEQQQQLALQQAAMQHEHHLQQQQLGMPQILQERIVPPQPANYPVRSDYDFSKPPKAKPKKKESSGPIVQIRPGPTGPTVHSSVDLTARQKVALRALLPNAMKTVQESNQSIFIRLPAAEVFEPKTRAPVPPTQNDLGLTEAQLQPHVDENDLRAALAQITRNAPKIKKMKKSKKHVDEHGFASSRRPSDFMTSPIPRDPMSPGLNARGDQQNYSAVGADYLKQTIQAALKQGNLSEEMARRLHDLQKIQAEKERQAAEAAAAAAAAAAATAEVAAAVMHHPPSPAHEVEYDASVDGLTSPTKKTGGAKRRPQHSPVPVAAGEEIVEATVKKEEEKVKHPERAELIAYMAELRKDIMRKRVQWEVIISQQVENELAKARQEKDRRRPSPPPVRKYPASPPKKRARSRDRSPRRDERRYKSSKSRRSDDVRSRDKKRKKSRQSSRRAESPRRSEVSRKRRASPSPSPPRRKPDVSSPSKAKKLKLSTGTFKTPSFTPRPKKETPRRSPAASPAAGTPGTPGGSFDWAIKGRPAPKMKNSLTSRSKHPLVGSKKRKAGSIDTKYVRPPKIQKTSSGATPTAAPSAASPKARPMKSSEPMYCLCRTPYDNKKFYIGCDFCEDWFHGTCVNITEPQASSMKEFMCPLCAQRKKDHGKGQKGTDGQKPERRRSQNKARKLIPAQVAETNGEALPTVPTAGGSRDVKEEAVIVEDVKPVELPPVQEKKKKDRRSAKAPVLPKVPAAPEQEKKPPVATEKKPDKKGKKSTANAVVEEPPPATPTPKSPVKASPKAPAASRRSKKVPEPPAAPPAEEIPDASVPAQIKSKQPKAATPAAAKDTKKAAGAIKSPAVKNTKISTPKQTPQAAKSNKKTPASPKKAATPKEPAKKKVEPKSPAVKKDSKTPAAKKDSKTPAAKAAKTSAPKNAKTPAAAKDTKAASAKKDSKTPAAAKSATKTSAAVTSSKKAAGGKRGGKAEEVDSDELYCLCRKPYDQTKFYICCDRCSDWFHGTCVGILPLEANDIEEYLCPNCGPKTPLNCANFAMLKQSSFNDLRTMLDEIKAIKYAAAFVDTTEMQKEAFYKKVIKEPADFKLMEAKLDSKEYRSMKDVIADLIRIFSNCRVYYPDNSEQCKNAAKLEIDVVKKVKAFRLKIAKNLSLNVSGL